MDYTRALHARAEMVCNASSQCLILQAEISWVQHRKSTPMVAHMQAQSGALLCVPIAALGPSAQLRLR